MGTGGPRRGNGGRQGDRVDGGDGTWETDRWWDGTTPIFFCDFSGPGFSPPAMFGVARLQAGLTAAHCRVKGVTAQHGAPRTITMHEQLQLLMVHTGGEVQHHGGKCEKCWAGCGRGEGDADMPRLSLSACLRLRLRAVAVAWRASARVWDTASQSTLGQIQHKCASLTPRRGVHDLRQGWVHACAMEHTTGYANGCLHLPPATGTRPSQPHTTSFWAAPGAGQARDIRH